MAAEGSWLGIARHGLRSTTALLDLFEVRGRRRAELEMQHRPECVTIRHPRHGEAVLRDQKPMSDSGLKRSLTDGLTPADWYRILNRKVFFWLTTDRLKILRGARAYADSRQTVLVLDTLRLLRRAADRVVLSPMNSGCTTPFAHPRGLRTFLPLSEYPYQDRVRRRREPVVELAVDYKVEDIESFVISAVEMGGGRALETIKGSASDVD